MKAYNANGVTIHQGDAWTLAETLEPQSINCIVTSPPYWGLRDYGTEGQFGLEPTPAAYVAKLVDLFERLKPALKDDGTVWLNLGDSYCNAGSQNNGEGLDGSRRGGMQGTDGTWADARDKRGDKRHALREFGIKHKDLIGIPWRVAFALQDAGWYLRSDIIWSKPNPMPESVRDRPTKSHEYIFLLAKSPRYYYDLEAIRLPVSENWKQGGGAPVQENGIGRLNGTAPTRQLQYTEPKGANARTVWSIPTEPTPYAHFATFPKDLIRPCIRAGCPSDGVVLDPFGGSGTTAHVCREEGRRCVLFELNPKYIDIATRHRLAQMSLLTAEVVA